MIGEREVLAAMLEVDAGLVAARADILLSSDKGFASALFEKDRVGQRHPSKDCSAGKNAAVGRSMASPSG